MKMFLFILVIAMGFVVHAEEGSQLNSVEYKNVLKQHRARRDLAPTYNVEESVGVSEGDSHASPAPLLPEGEYRKSIKKHRSNTSPR